MEQATGVQTPSHMAYDAETLFMEWAFNPYGGCTLTCLTCQAYSLNKPVCKTLSRCPQVCTKSCPDLQTGVDAVHIYTQCPHMEDLQSVATIVEYKLIMVLAKLIVPNSSINSVP